MNVANVKRVITSCVKSHLVQIVLRYVIAFSHLIWTYFSYACPGQTRKHCCGNICDSRCFLKCFPVCPPVETLLRKQNLLPGKQKCFLSNSETFHVSQAWFLLRKHCFLVFAHLGKHGETLAGNNVSATIHLRFHFVNKNFYHKLGWRHLEWNRLQDLYVSKQFHSYLYRKILWWMS